MKSMFLSPLLSRRCLAYAYFLLNVSLDMLIKKKHVLTDIENLKLEKSYVLFSAVSLLISDILQWLINRCSINMY